MIVMKIGGTSVGDVAAIERVAEIVRSQLDRRPVVVISAMGKTTRRLLNMAALAADGQDEAATRLLNQLREDHIAIAQGAIDGFALSETAGKIQQYLDDIDRDLQTIRVSRALVPAMQDQMAAYGELLSTTIVAAAFAQRNIHSIWLDIRELMKTDDQFTRAMPLFELTSENLRSRIIPLVESGHVPVLQGYIGSTLDNATTTLGFEGSDYTAAIVAASLDAEETQIWKDVDGLMTADPRVVKQALTVRCLSYLEAAELTYLGATVLHPKAVHQTAELSIPIHIYNARRQVRLGTVVCHESAASSNIVKSIAFKRGIVLLRIMPLNLADTTLVERALAVLAAHGATVYMLSGANAGLSVVVDETLLLDGLVTGLRTVGVIEVVNRIAILTLVGEGLQRAPAVSKIAFECLGEIALASGSFGASGRSLSLVVPEESAASLLGRLHERFFSEYDSEVFAPAEPVDQIPSKYIE